MARIANVALLQLLLAVVDPDALVLHMLLVALSFDYVGLQQIKQWDGCPLLPSKWEGGVKRSPS